jgi:hypothetical protein
VKSSKTRRQPVSRTILAKVQARDSAPARTDVPERRRLLREEQVEAIYGRPRKTLQNDRVRGVGWPFIKIGRGIWYRVGDIEDAIAAARRHSTSDDGKARQPNEQHAP